jgi:hypothetical protein
MSGISGMMVFLVIHHFWIMPIWFILPFGLVIALLGGLAVGWAYQELHPHLPPRPWTAIAWVFLIGSILSPSILLGELREPMFIIRASGSVLNMSAGQAAGIFVLELLVPSAVLAGLAGRLIGRTKRAVLSSALAGFVFALGPGHNIPFFGGTAGMWKGAVILGAVLCASSVVLVETQTRLQKEVMK